MKRLRITFEGAFHHTINRGINGEEIFSGDNNKSQKHLNWKYGMSFRQPCENVTKTCLVYTIFQ